MKMTKITTGSLYGFDVPMLINVDYLKEVKFDRTKMASLVLGGSRTTQVLMVPVPDNYATKRLSSLIDALRYAPTINPRHGNLYIFVDRVDLVSQVIPTTFLQTISPESPMAKKIPLLNNPTGTVVKLRVDDLTVISRAEKMITINSEENSIAAFQLVYNTEAVAKKIFNQLEKFLTRGHRDEDFAI